MNLPMAPSPTLPAEDIPALKEEVRALAQERGAVILAHNYQVPEVQDVADYVGDSLGLSRQGAATDAEIIAFCGVHFMAETASILSPGQDRPDPRPRRRLLAGRLDHARRSCSAWQAKFPGQKTVMYVNTTAEIKALTDYCCTSANAVDVVEHISTTHGADTPVLFGPDMWLGAYVEKELGVKLHVWDGECHVHAGIRPRDINDDARRASGRRLPHPPRVRLRRRRSWSTSRPATSTARASTCSRPAGC